MTEGGPDGLFTAQQADELIAAIRADPCRPGCSLTGQGTTEISLHSAGH